MTIGIALSVAARWRASAARRRILETRAGGANVPVDTGGLNGQVPASGTIKLSDFYDTTNITPEALVLTQGIQGTIRGYVSGVIGALAPNTFRGQFIFSLVTNDGLTLSLNIQTGSLPQYYFNRLVISGGPTVAAKDASIFDPQVGDTQWEWPVAYAFPAGNTTVTFQ